MSVSALVKECEINAVYFNIVALYQHNFVCRNNMHVLLSMMHGLVRFNKCLANEN